MSWQANDGVEDGAQSQELAADDINQSPQVEESHADKEQLEHLEQSEQGEQDKSGLRSNISQTTNSIGVGGTLGSFMQSNGANNSSNEFAFVDSSMSFTLNQLSQMISLNNAIAAAAAAAAVVSGSASNVDTTSSGDVSSADNQNEPVCSPAEKLQINNTPVNNVIISNLDIDLSSGRDFFR
jgi:hypothetical protein